MRDKKGCKGCRRRKKEFAEKLKLRKEAEAEALRLKNLTEETEEKS